MRIEPASIDDVDVLVDQWVDLAREQRAHRSRLLAEANRTAIRDDFTSRAVTGGVLVAREEGGEPADAPDDSPPGREAGIAGFVSFGRREGDYTTDHDRGVIYNLYVRPDRRGEGVGKDLLSAAEDRLADIGATVVSLEAMADNEAARRFYRRAGYQVHRVEMERELEEVTGTGDGNGNGNGDRDGNGNGNGDGKAGSESGGDQSE